VAAGVGVGTEALALAVGVRRDAPVLVPGLAGSWLGRQRGWGVEASGVVASGRPTAAGGDLAVRSCGSAGCICLLQQCRGEWRRRAAGWWEVLVVRTLSYVDAVRVLGGGEGKAAAVLGRLTGGLLVTAGASAGWGFVLR
jgi:hypothetical protein